jgi:hypothetical protein
MCGSVSVTTSELGRAITAARPRLERVFIRNKAVLQRGRLRLLRS